MKKPPVMENDTNVLSAEFDGIFRFTNWTDKDFTSKWDSVEYTFPALKTVPLIIPNATPQEVQSIRKKFALDLATYVFHNSDKFKSMDLTIEESQAGKVPALYTDKDIAPYVQRCLEPLPAAVAKTVIAPAKEIKLSTDQKGKKVSKVLDGDESLVGDGTVIA